MLLYVDVYSLGRQTVVKHKETEIGTRKYNLRPPKHATEVQQSHESSRKLVEYNSFVVSITGATVTINKFKS